MASTLPGGHQTRGRAPFRSHRGSLSPSDSLQLPLALLLLSRRTVVLTFMYAIAFFLFQA